MTLKLFILAVLFVISGGVAFSEYFKNHKFISFLATAIAIIATFYLFQDIYDDLKQPSSSTQAPRVSEVTPPEGESSPLEEVDRRLPTKMATGEFAAYLQPKQDLFETTAAFQVRRRNLLQQFNDEVKQRNLDYQAGVLHLTHYDADMQRFTVNLYWQADWVKSFFGELQNKGVVQIGVKEAKQIYNEGAKKPLFITATLNDNQLEIQGSMVEKGRAYSILSYSILSYRYIDNGNGTVTDTRTGLIWLKNANCFGLQDWDTAMQSAANLASGQCGLRDSSKQGMWRLPSKEEWEAMIDKKYVDRENYSQPKLSNAAGTGPWKEGDAFSGVHPSFYWSSTPYATVTNCAWVVNREFGYVDFGGETNACYVWPVRDRQ
ncbi:MAG: hypothetical protein DRR19_11595 [Candidatus Parabeggiatoa sp. nov. 1]|nr:MAG: hypothetical protein DRR19_11595 [Gammaproteobacteria bacterium]